MIRRTLGAAVAVTSPTNRIRQQRITPSNLDKLPECRQALVDLVLGFAVPAGLGHFSVVKSPFAYGVAFKMGCRALARGDAGPSGSRNALGVQAAGEAAGAQGEG